MIACCLGVFFPHDGCVPLFFVAYWVYGVGLLGVCGHAAGLLPRGTERTVEALLSSIFPPLGLVPPLVRLCQSLHFSFPSLCPSLGHAWLSWSYVCP